MREGLCVQENGPTCVDWQVGCDLTWGCKEKAVTLMAMVVSTVGGGKHMEFTLPQVGLAAGSCGVGHKDMWL
jgi:hypothetical protein